jgi:tetratricopeptide (TPR) repeat protein
MKYSHNRLLELENLVRAGDFTAVAKALRGLNARLISREHLVHYANIANRVDQPRFAHRILTGIVRADKDMNIVPTEIEKIEYAEALRSMGLNSEAKKILSEVDTELYPVAHLRMAFCSISQWKYHEAIPSLRKYLELVNTQEYSHLVARVNLAAALVSERLDDEAIVLLEQLKKDTQSGSHRLLLGNCLELMSQIYILQGHHAIANRLLDEASAIIGDSQSRFSLYLLKWKAISTSLQMKSVHPDLVKCREVAGKNLDWETVRDCDLYIAVLGKDKNLLSHVYFGTPYSSYRKRILGPAGRDLDLSDNYVWRSSQGKSAKAEIFNLLEGRFEKSGEAMETGRLMHRMLILLCSDFYRPLSVSRAFSELFPEENFFQTGSANRVAQIVKRLRAWFAKTSEHFEITEQDGYYRLKLHAGVGVRVPREIPTLSLQSVAWKKLRRHLPAEPFSKHDVIQQLGYSKASAERLLRWAVATGEAVVIGGGPSRRYKLSVDLNLELR